MICEIFLFCFCDVFVYIGHLESFYSFILLQVFILCIDIVQCSAIASRFHISKADLACFHDVATHTRNLFSAGFSRCSVPR